MNSAELAEIRALLQANTPVERRAKAPLFGALRAILPVRREVQPELAPARRIGLRMAEPEDVEAVEAMLLDQPAEEDSPRQAFGQRRETVIEPAPLLRLTAPAAHEETTPPPSVDDADVAEVMRRRGLRLSPVAAPHETPYHPEDLSDPAGHDADQLYLDSGLFDVPSDEPQTEAELLQRLEHMLLAERAALFVRTLG